MKVFSRNAAAATQGRELRDTEEAIASLGAELAPVRIHNRIAYSRAQQTGLTAQELDPTSKAADEIERLYEYVCMHLYAETRRRAAG